jgi:NTP pyrophosphatase (non-canonical NTP hydrolase)
MEGQDPMGVEPRAHAEHVDAVEHFGMSMVRKLDKNALKGHWRDGVSVHYLLTRLEEEVKELRAAVTDGTPSRILDEASDVANFAMFVADIYSNRERK